MLWSLSLLVTHAHYILQFPCFPVDILPTSSCSMPSQVCGSVFWRFAPAERLISCLPLRLVYVPHGILQFAFIIISHSHFSFPSLSYFLLCLIFILTISNTLSGLLTTYCSNGKSRFSPNLIASDFPFRGKTKFYRCTWGRLCYWAIYLYSGRELACQAYRLYVHR